MLRESSGAEDTEEGSEENSSEEDREEVERDLRSVWGYSEEF